MSVVAAAASLCVGVASVQAAEPAFKQSARTAIEGCKALKDGTKRDCLTNAKSVRKQDRKEFRADRAVAKAEAKKQRKAGLLASLENCKTTASSTKDGKTCAQALRATHKADRETKKAEHQAIRDQRRAERAANKDARIVRKETRKAL